MTQPFRLSNLLSYGPLKIGKALARLPIVQGGMGVGISLSSLATAVAVAGGIGVISAAFIGGTPRYRDRKISHAEALKLDIGRAKAATDGVIGVNIMVALTDVDALAKAADEAGADVIFAGAGLPLTLPNSVRRDSKTALVPIVSSAKAAKLLVKWWKDKYGRKPDGFVVEGPLAGGHLGFKPEQVDDPAYALDALVTDVLEVAQPLDIPVIAAGGLFSGQDVKQVLDLGASGAQLGTRFVATEECDAPAEFKEAYITCEPEDIAIVQSPVGMPGRAIKGELVTKAAQGLMHPRRCRYQCITTCKRLDSPYCIADALLTALDGDTQNGLVFVGANGWRINEVSNVAGVMAALDSEMGSGKDQA